MTDMGKKLFSSDYQPENRRPKGVHKKTAMLQAIENEFEGGTKEFCEKVLKIGMTGGVEGQPVPALLSECLKRVEPPLKPQGSMIELDMPEGATKAEQTEVIMQAVYSGTISSDIGAMLIGMIKDSIAIEESTDLAKRLEEVEKALSR